MHFTAVELLLSLLIENVRSGFVKVGAMSGDLGSARRWDCDAEERELLTDRQVFQHVVLSGYLHREAKHRGQEQSVEHGRIHECGGWLIECKVALQVVHTLAV